jgi:Lon protease-like protein
MFPLGSPLLPAMLLPLRLFEPRYRVFARDVLGGERRFGVVMIERGSEVGGGDVRADTGCLASVIEAEELPDGQVVLLCVGTDRIRVSEWLDDDPYPRAIVASWPDEAGHDPQLDELLSRFHEVTSIAAELDPARSPLTAGLEIAEDPQLAVYQIALASPLGALDRHRVLCAPSLGARAALLEELLDDAALVLRAHRDLS